ncbi:GNAT family N-acetyltransferase [Halomarina ordinaria]|uniref:GNAT family N-acetyltransferase n=1 Tax=Halomarina ordinaria TaxID=3033939 RepID=A0ABD5UBD5_9EURY|nr:GNAT family N-acetyltransferase [Halomarina sp. PSRA2]
MTVTIERTEDETEWNRLVDRSPQTAVCHRHEWIRTIAEFSDARLHPLVGYRGDDPVGLLPLFDLRKGPVSVVFSPPPDVGVEYLGPALVSEDGSRRSRDAACREFVESCLEYVESELAPQFVYLKTTTRFEDVRPFQWNGFDVEPKFTFVVDVGDDPERLQAGFSRSLRRTLNTEFERPYEVTVGGESTVAFVHREMRNRYEAQGKRFAIDLDYVKALYERLPEGSVLPYRCEVDGELVGGKVCVGHEGVLYSWLESGIPDPDFPVNEVTTWEILRDAPSRGVTAYDLYGADVANIAFFKSKFNPDLVHSYTVSKGSLPMRLLERVYRRL